MKQFSEENDSFCEVFWRVGGEYCWFEDEEQTFGVLFEVLDEDNESFRIIHQAAHELKPTDQNVLFHQPKAIFNHYLESKVLLHLSKGPPHEIYQSVSII